MPINVLIAGGGPAALEAALALHRLAGERVTTTVLAPESELTYRPLSVLAPFAAGEPTRYRLERIARDAGFTHRRGRLARVDSAAHDVLTDDGERIGYDVLLVATGAKLVEPYERATVFTGSDSDQERLHGMVQDVEEGYLRRIAFVVPEGNTWPLPLYELALMLAERAYSMCAEVELSLITPETAPLAVFGPDASREVDALLRQAGVRVHTATTARQLAHGRLDLGTEIVDVDRLVTLPRLEGPRIAGLPANPDGFLVTDSHSRVTGVPDVYAAGDVTAFRIKQGGIACQQADAAAADIAARAGAPVEPEPFEPVLRGMLLTESWARFLRRQGDEPTSDVAGRALWWPPTKIAGRELAGYLEALDERAGVRVGIPVNVNVGNAGDGPIEVLSLH